MREDLHNPVLGVTLELSTLISTWDHTAHTSRTITLERSSKSVRSTQCTSDPLALSSDKRPKLLHGLCSKALSLKRSPYPTFEQTISYREACPPVFQAALRRGKTHGNAQPWEYSIGHPTFRLPHNPPSLQNRQQQ